MFVATKASLLRKNAETTFQSVTFQNKKRKEPPISNDGEQEERQIKQTRKTEIPDMRKLRYEIIKFGTSGFSGGLREDANTALLVSLGAEKPKNKGKNYKELLEEKKKSQNKDADSDEKKYRSLKYSNKQKSNQNFKRKRKDVKGLLNVYGEVKNLKRKGAGGGGKKKR